ncbi:response regulator transcription factor [Microbulbifer yueqingensis]|nr:LuxR C-terminal-related transcriptional regulator [Microbulbifer yueqingensis]
MPVLFYSNSGLHGDLLFCLISDSLPGEWEKAEIGRQRHCLPHYSAIVIDCSQISVTAGENTLTRFLLSVSHPNVLLVDYPADFPESLSTQIESRGIEFLCDSHCSQDTLLEKLGTALGGRKQQTASERQRHLLTRREQEILSQLTSGESNSVIATRLHLSEHTVKNHIYNIFRKIGVKNRLQASNWAKLHLEEERI